MSIRFEKLFSRRKALLSHDSNSERSSSPSSLCAADIDSGEQYFPPPSFIRPKALRMAAREEVSASFKRSPSVQDDVNPPKRVCSIHARASSSSLSSSLSQLLRVPQRTSSLLHAWEDAAASLDDLANLQFPDLMASSSTPCASVRSSAQVSPLEPSRERKRQMDEVRGPVVRLPPSHRLDTPPPSDLEEAYQSSASEPAKRTSIVRADQLTPETSPRWAPC